MTMKTMLLKSPNDPDIPRNASDISCVKEERMKGEREREIELGEEVLREKHENT